MAKKQATQANIRPMAPKKPATIGVTSAFAALNSVLDAALRRDDHAHAWRVLDAMMRLIRNFQETQDAPIGATARVASATPAIGASGR
jgi:hypothetical protein